MSIDIGSSSGRRFSWPQRHEGTKGIFSIAEYLGRLKHMELGFNDGKTFRCQTLNQFCGIIGLNWPRRHEGTKGIFSIAEQLGRLKHIELGLNDGDVP